MIAVDVGYGMTKGVSLDGRRVIFPSVVAPGRSDLLEGVFTSRVGHLVKVRKVSGESAEMLVGEAAVRSMAAVVSMTHEKPAAVHDLMVLTAAYLLGAGSEGVMPRRVDLAVGLPLAFYKAQKEGLKDRLKGLSAWVSVDGGPEKYISFGSVYVLPQGAGVFLNEFGLANGGYAGVVDVGTYTTDYLMLEQYNGQPAPNLEGCGSFEAGVHLLRQAASEEFQKQTGVPLPYEMAQKVVDAALEGKPVKYYGRELHLKNVQRLKKQIGDGIARKVLSVWGNRAGYVEATLLAGGGSLVFREELEAALPGPVMARDPVFANALGYLTVFRQQG